MSGRPPRVLVASDKFKGTFSSDEVGRAIASGLAEAGIDCHALPVADGGEGTARALLATLGGSVHPVIVQNEFGLDTSAEKGYLMSRRVPGN